MKNATIETEKEKLLKKVKVGSHTYKVFICNKLFINGLNYFGFIDYERRNIYLKKDKNIKETLNHELTHALVNEIYLKCRSNKKLIKKLRSDENFINSLSCFISY